MSGRALWAPRKLDSFNWRAAIVEERQSRGLPFEAWQRPAQEEASVSPGGAEDSKERPSLRLAWVGFTVTGLTVTVFVLSTIYSQLESALTGVAAPGLPLGVLIVSAVSGLLLGIIGLTLGSRGLPQGQPSEGRDNGPRTSIAA